MDIKKEREAFEGWFSCNAIRDHEYVRGERMDENGNYYSEYAYLAWSAWQAAKAQAVPEGFGDIQSWIAVNSFSALDASIVDFPVVDANELAEFIDSLNIDVVVPEGFAIKDVINERQRQVNQEFYSIENDDEYKENELVRAAACYTNNVVSRGWTYSESDLETYQSEEAPDFWPWDLDFWKPKSPRKDLVRAAALLIAEIERIDRAQEPANEN